MLTAEHGIVAVPFTPSQGVLTPSPGNMAHRYYQQYCGYSHPHYIMAGGGVHLSPLGETAKFMTYQQSWAPVRFSPPAPLSDA